MTPPIRLGFLSSKNYLDKNTFSGTLYYMHKALQKHPGIQLINLGKPWKPYFSGKIFHKLSNNFHQTKQTSLDLRHSKYSENCDRFASIVEEQLKKTPCDLIFAPIASVEISCLQLNLPFVYLSDVTFKILREFYQQERSQQQTDLLNRMESNAIEKASQLIYSSTWAADSAKFDYGASSDKVHVIPFGANLDKSPTRAEVAEREKGSKCRLLFIGKDWNRKGGEIAFQTLKSLLSLGVEAELTIIGCTPPSHISHSCLKVIPYLDKNIPQQFRKLEEIFLQSHFLVFPTRADCSPIIICEANAFGIPVMTTALGGIPSILRQGSNGYMFPASASGVDYAQCIAEIFSDYAKYKHLSLSTKEEYESRLNWNSWANSFYKVIEEALVCENFQNVLN